MERNNIIQPVFNSPEKVKEAEQFILNFKKFHKMITEQLCIPKELLKYYG